MPPLHGTPAVPSSADGANWVEVPINRSFSDGDKSTWPTDPKYGRPSDSLYREKLAKMWIQKRDEYEPGWFPFSVPFYLDVSVLFILFSSLLLSLLVLFPFCRILGELTCPCWASLGLRIWYFVGLYLNLALSAVLAIIYQGGFFDIL